MAVVFQVVHSSKDDGQSNQILASGISDRRCVLTLRNKLRLQFELSVVI